MEYGCSFRKPAAISAVTWQTGYLESALNCSTTAYGMRPLAERAIPFFEAHSRTAAISKSRVERVLAWVPIATGSSRLAVEPCRLSSVADSTSQVFGVDGGTALDYRPLTATLALGLQLRSSTSRPSDGHNHSQR